MYLLPILSIDSYVCVPASGRTASSLVIVLTAQRLLSLSLSIAARFIRQGPPEFAHGGLSHWFDP
jgi:hypothetical protein